MKITLLFLAAAVAFGQQINLQTQSRGVLRPINGGTGSAPGATLPTTCPNGVGSLFFKTNALPGLNLFGCTSISPVTWTLQSGSGGSGVWGAIAGALSAQTDLFNALALKAPLLSPVFTGEPTIPDFTLSGHSHQNTAGGGTLNAAAIAAGILTGGVGGTNNGFWSIAGPAITLKTWTVANSSIDFTALTGVGTWVAGIPGVVPGSATDCVLVNGTSGACGGGSSTPPYTLCASGCDTTIPASGSTILASAHSQGVNAVGFYFDNSNIRVLVTETRNSSGDLTIVYTGTLGRGIISGLAGSGGGGGGTTYAAGPSGNISINTGVTPNEIDTTSNVMGITSANTPTGANNFGGASATIPNKTGLSAAIPGTCSVGQTYYKTDAVAGSNLFGCTAANTWTLLGGGGGGGGGTVTTSNGSANRIAVYDGATSINGQNGSTNEFGWNGYAFVVGGSIRAKFNGTGNSVDCASTTALQDILASTLRIRLTGNCTASSSGVADGMVLTVQICQDGTGSRTFAWPANYITPMTVGATASKCSVQQFIGDATNSKYFAVAAGVTNQ